MEAQRFLRRFGVRGKPARRASQAAWSTPQGRKGALVGERLRPQRQGLEGIQRSRKAPRLPRIPTNARAKTNEDLFYLHCSCLFSQKTRERSTRIPPRRTLSL